MQLNYYFVKNHLSEIICTLTNAFYTVSQKKSPFLFLYLCQILLIFRWHMIQEIYNIISRSISIKCQILLPGNVHKLFLSLGLKLISTNLA